MPQLNYRNPEVLNFICNKLTELITNFNVDGLKFGAVNLISVDPSFYGEPLSGIESDGYDGLYHVYTRDLTDSLYVVRDIVKYLKSNYPDL